MITTAPKLRCRYSVVLPPDRESYRLAAEAKLSPFLHASGRGACTDRTSTGRRGGCRGSQLIQGRAPRDLNCQLICVPPPFAPRDNLEGRVPPLFCEPFLHETHVNPLPRTPLRLLLAVALWRQKQAARCRRRGTKNAEPIAGKGRQHFETRCLPVRSQRAIAPSPVAVGSTQHGEFAMDSCAKAACMGKDCGIGLFAGAWRSLCGRTFNCKHDCCCRDRRQRTLAPTVRTVAHTREHSWIWPRSSGPQQTQSRLCCLSHELWVPTGS